MSVRTEGCDGESVACNDNSAIAGGFQSAVTLNAVAGSEYLLFIDGFRGSRGAFRLSSRLGACDGDNPPPECVVDTDCPLGDACRAEQCVEVVETPTPGDVVVSEVMYDPIGNLDDARGEWVELYNGSNIARTLDGCFIKDSDDIGNGVDGSPLDGMIIPPLERIVIGRLADPGQNGGVDVAGIFNFRLNNGG